MKKKFLILPILAAFLLSSVSALANVGVQEDGTPLGSATNINFSNGLTATSDGSTVTVIGGAVGDDGNFTGDGLTVTADLAPTKFIFTGSSGDLFATGFTAGTGDITFGQGGKIDGDTNGTMKLIEASDTLSFIFSGSTIQLDSSDGGFQFGMTSAGEGYVDFLTNADTDDYLRISTVSDVPTIVTVGTSNLAIAPDSGTTAVTGILTVSSGLTASSTITLQNGETIVNSTNGTVTVGGATTPILNVLDAGTSDSDALLSLSADAAADSGDVWRLNSDGATNSLFFENNLSGSQATILTLANTGLITTTGDVTVAGTTPLVTIGDGGDEDAGIQLNSDTTDYYIASENTLDALILGSGSAIGTVPILTLLSTSTVLTGSTDGILTIWAAGATASDAYLRLVGDIQTDAADSWELFNDSSAGTLYFGNDDATPGTYVTKASFASTGAVTFQGSEGTGGSLGIWADNGDDAIDKVVFAVADGGALTMTTGAVTGYTVSAAGLVSLPNSNTLGDAITDINTFTGKIAGATPMSFDGTTADTVYTIFAIADPTSASKTITFPASTGAVMLSALTTNDVDAANSVTGISNGLIFEGSSADGFETSLVPTNVGADATITLPTITGTLHGSGAVVALTPGATPTLTVVPGRQVFTYAPADNTDATFNASGTGSAGDTMTFVFTTDGAGSGDEVMTFGTNFTSSLGTLTMANLVSDKYVCNFVSIGTGWVETGRTIVQTT